RGGAPSGTEGRASGGIAAPRRLQGRFPLARGARRDGGGRAAPDRWRLLDIFRGLRRHRADRDSCAQAGGRRRRASGDASCRQVRHGAAGRRSRRAHRQGPRRRQLERRRPPVHRMDTPRAGEPRGVAAAQRRLPQAPAIRGSAGRGDARLAGRAHRCRRMAAPGQRARRTRPLRRRVARLPPGGRARRARRREPQPHRRHRHAPRTVRRRARRLRPGARALSGRRRRIVRPGVRHAAAGARQGRRRDREGNRCARPLVHRLEGAARDRAVAGHELPHGEARPRRLTRGSRHRAARPCKAGGHRRAYARDSSVGTRAQAMSKPSSGAVVWTALAMNLVIAVTKGIAAAITGSAAMLSECVHSFVDTSNEVLLLYGTYRAKRPPDDNHPFGYGRELYFWSFVVALIIFALGAGVAIVKGSLQVMAPEPVESPLVSYAVLAAAFLFDGISWYLSLRRFVASKGTLGFYEAFRRSKDPATFIVLFED